MNIMRADRSYIQRFSKAYKILYKDAVFLPEIFDSAQEGYSHLWVNGEKYVFSDDVLNSGTELKQAFKNLKQDLQIFESTFKYKINGNEHFREVKEDLNSFLEKFDQIWTRYEKNYILELMVIESDSRRYVKIAIDAEKELQVLENNQFNLSTSSKKDYKSKLKESKAKLIE